MALRGQRFELDLDADDLTPKPLIDHAHAPARHVSVIGEIKENIPASAPSPPKLRVSKTGFPEHRRRINISALDKQRHQHGPSSQLRPAASIVSANSVPTQLPPSDQAIARHVARKYGYDFDTKERREISDENKQRIAEMSEEDIEEARAELMAKFSPALIERLLGRVNHDNTPQIQEEEIPVPRFEDERPAVAISEPPGPDEHTGIATAINSPREAPSIIENQAGLQIHFPTPPRSSASFIPLDPNSPSFQSDLKAHYFPNTPHDPSSLSWLQDFTAEETEESAYNPSKLSYPASKLRFSFTGALIAPKQSLRIDVIEGLHHHGEDPASAGYTIPELAILSRSNFPAQRCIAYQTVGRVLYRLGKGNFGPEGEELQEALWDVVEKERVLELIMAEASGRKGGHASAKAYAIDALWLWKRGGGGDRGMSKQGDKTTM